MDGCAILIMDIVSEFKKRERKKPINLFGCSLMTEKHFGNGNLHCQFVNDEISSRNILKPSLRLQPDVSN